MRIWLVEISDFLPKIDGNSRLYRAGMLAKALVAAGHEVFWWSSTFNHQLRCQRFKASMTIKVEKNLSLRLLYGPGYNRSISLDRIKHNRAVAKKFASEITCKPNIEMPDLIYACLPTLEVCEQAVLFGFQQGIPVVVDIRDRWPEIYLSALPKLLHPFIRVILKNDFNRAHKILSKATAITAVSFTNLEWGLKLAGRKVSQKDKWYPLGFPKQKEVNQDKFTTDYVRHKFGLKIDRFIITFIGSFSLTCNFKTVIDVARALVEANDDRVQFVLVGDGAQAALLKKASKELYNILLIGWCDKIQVNEILLNSSIGLAPYTIKAPQTLPNKPFEYMSVGLPILSSLKGELQDIIEEEGIGLYYNASDPYDLRTKIEWFLSHPHDKRTMGKRAKELFEEKYNENIVYASLVEYLTNIVNEGASA